MTEENEKLELKDKVLAFYAKLKTQNKGPVYRMVMEDVLKDYQQYFGIILKKKEK
jgi:hypothetical protein